MLVVDASLVMEASRSRETDAVEAILNISETEEIVEGWNKARHKIPNEPALVIICPVKCESYFNDNGGSRNNSEELYQKIWQLYRNMIETIIAEYPGKTDILYMPVDTVGCVEFSHAEWANLNTDKPVFKPSFCVRGIAKPRVRGANDVLLAVSKQVINYQKKWTQQVKEDSSKKAEKARMLAKNKNFWLSLVSIFRDTAIDKDAKAASEDADKALKNAQTTADLMQALARKKFGDRVRIICRTEVTE